MQLQGTAPVKLIMKKPVKEPLQVNIWQWLGIDEGLEFIAEILANGCFTKIMDVACSISICIIGNSLKLPMVVKRIKILM